VQISLKHEMDLGVVLLGLLFLYIMWSEVKGFLTGDVPCPEGQERLEAGGPCTDIEPPPTLLETVEEKLDAVNKKAEQHTGLKGGNIFTHAWYANTPDNWLARNACWATSPVHRGACKTSGGHDFQPAARGGVRGWWNS